MNENINKIVKSEKIKYVICIVLVLVLTLVLVLLAIELDYIFLAVVTGIFIFMILSLLFVNFKHKINNLNSIDKKTLNKLEKELDNPTLVIKNYYILTESFIFINNNYKIVKYDDIVFLSDIETRKKKTSLIVVITKNKELYTFAYNTKKIIISKNKDIVTDRKKQKILKEKYNIDLKEFLDE